MQMVKQQVAASGNILPSLA